MVILEEIINKNYLPSTQETNDSQNILHIAAHFGTEEILSSLIINYPHVNINKRNYYGVNFLFLKRHFILL